jgi:hypothetical protein
MTLSFRFSFQLGWREVRPSLTKSYHERSFKAQPSARGCPHWHLAAVEQPGGSRWGRALAGPGCPAEHCQCNCQLLVHGGQLAESPGSPIHQGVPSVSSGVLHVSYCSVVVVVCGEGQDGGAPRAGL